MALTKKQAKEGLWIRDPMGTVSQLHHSTLGLCSGSYYAFEDCTLWEPMDGEWCWFWDDGTSLKIGKFSHMLGKEYAMNYGSVFKSFEYCEPFLGKLPTMLKAKGDEDE